MNPDVKKTLSRAKALIERGRYQQALSLLEEIEHPIASRWQQKLQKRTKRQTEREAHPLAEKQKKRRLREVEKLIDAEKYDIALAKLATIDHPTAYKWANQLKKKINTRSQSAVKKEQPATSASLFGCMLIIMFICGGFTLLSSLLSDTSSDDFASVPATDIVLPTATPLPTWTPRPVIRQGLRNQVYDYSSLNTSRTSGSSSSSSSGNNWNCTGDIYNCSVDDFSSMSEMRDYFNSCPDDPSDLDHNSDGIPCEQGLQ